MSKSFRWPDDRRCAVSLTYDDALPLHYGIVAPRLEAHGLRGSFYLKIAASPMQDPTPWREIAARGHELGNHTIFHPCRRSRERRHWLPREFDLRGYTPARLQLELRVANAYLNLLDGKRERTFANTCFDRFIGGFWNRTAIADVIREDFIAARGTRTDRPTMVSRSLDIMDVGSYLADGRTFAQLRTQVCAARDHGGWVVFVFHGIGAETHSSCVEADVHEELLGWLADQDDVWIKPFITVASLIREWQRTEASA